MSESPLVKSVTDQNFQAEVLKSTRPTLVDFWATWCAPCRAIAPIVDELANQYGEKINFRKIDIDDNPSIPMQYGVKGIPTLMLFRDGQVVDQVVGAVPRASLEKLLQKAL